MYPSLIHYITSSQRQENNIELGLDATIIYLQPNKHSQKGVHKEKITMRCQGKNNTTQQLYVNTIRTQKAVSNDMQRISGAKSGQQFLHRL